MQAMLGFELDFWDYMTFLSGFVVAGGFIAVAMFVLGLPGRIAVARNHPEAEAVNLMGWAGLGTVYPWIQALIWAFKPTDVIDIRRGPREEQRAIEEDIARLSHEKVERKEEGIRAVIKEAAASPSPSDAVEPPPAPRSSRP